MTGYCKNQKYYPAYNISIILKLPRKIPFKTYKLSTSYEHGKLGRTEYIRLVFRYIFEEIVQSYVLQTMYPI
jgi:hypothetical protein